MSTTVTLIMTIAMQMGFDPNMAVAIAQYESSLNPRAVGSIGEVGLFQLRPEFFAPSCREQNIAKSYKKVPALALTEIIETAHLPVTPKVYRLKIKKTHICGQELFDPETNIRIAIAHLIETQEKFSHYGKFGFLVAYNIGYTKAKTIKNPAAFKYAVKVEANYNKLPGARNIASLYE